MAKGKKTSPEDTAKVIEAKINNPDMSIRGIAQLTGVSKSVTGTILADEMPEIADRSDRVADLIDRNNRLMSVTDELLFEKLGEGEDVRVGELVKVRESAFKQNQIMGDRPTEIVKTDIDLSELATEEILGKIKEKINANNN